MCNSLASHLASSQATAMYHISMACNSLPDLHLFGATFLTACFAFLRMSNIAPDSSENFDPSRYFLRQDIVFGHPGVYLIIKWAKTLQDHRSHHIDQLPQLKNLPLPSEST